MTVMPISTKSHATGHPKRLKARFIAEAALAKLRSDKRLIAIAARAQQTADYILGRPYSAD
jgi:hypothetical protein